MEEKVLIQDKPKVNLEAIRKYGIDPDSIHLLGTFVAFDMDPNAYADAVFPASGDKQGWNASFRQDLKTWFNLDTYEARDGQKVYNIAEGNKPQALIILERVTDERGQRSQRTRVAFLPEKFPGLVLSDLTYGLTMEGYVRERNLIAPIPQPEFRDDLLTLISNYVTDQS